MKARVHVTLKPGVLDPQGKAVGARSGRSASPTSSEVRVGKIIELDLAAGDRAAAEAEVEAMCRTLLANTVIENYAVEIA